MHIEWHITETDLDCVRRLADSQRDTVLVSDRRMRNLAKKKDPVTKERLWRSIVCMRLTTQARSGPKGKLASFQQMDPFPLGYNALFKQRSLEAFIVKVLRSYGVGRHPTIISEQLAANFRRLEKGEWTRAIDQCNRLTKKVERRVEAEVADYIAEILDGFGPKQSRNVLQALGLTRFEIPIDSRVTDWLNKELNFPFQVSSTALGDKGYYGLVSDAICRLCEKCGMFPCVLDASIFGVKDGDGWSKEQLFF
jgi:hypothetical protein